MKKFFILIVSIMLLGVTNVSAMSPTYPNAIKFSRGVTNTCYYIDASASSYTSTINTASQQWDNMNNKINNTHVSSNYATHIDIYASTPSVDSNLNSNILAYTTIWSSTGTQMYFFGIYDYFYTEITLNQWGFGVDSRVVAHEFGHAYGLDENPENQYSIMHPALSNMRVSSPQSVDNDTINYLYP